jgi:hypothetical protein
MNRSFLLGLSTLCLAASAGLAQAQTSTVEPVGVSIRGGVFLPTSSDLNGRGNEFVAFGVEYKLFNIESPDPKIKTSVSFSLDYFARDDVSSIPFMANYVIRQQDIFGSVGVGFGLNRANGNDYSDFEYQVGVGYSFEHLGALPLFLEAKFWGSDRSEFDGVGLYAGLRF